MTKKLGRPKLPKDKARSAMVTCRMSPEEKREIMVAIKRSNSDQSEWLRKILLDAARAS